MKKNAPTKCDICGQKPVVKDLENEFGEAIKTFAWGIIIDSESSPEEERVREIFGQTKFHICMPCFIKQLGVRPHVS